MHVMPTIILEANQSSLMLECFGSAIRMSTLILAALASLVILEARSADRNHYFLNNIWRWIHYVLYSHWHLL